MCEYILSVHHAKQGERTDHRCASDDELTAKIREIRAQPGTSGWSIYALSERVEAQCVLRHTVIDGVAQDEPPEYRPG